MSHHRVAILLLALALPAQCATLFVSKSGDGTSGQSWETAFPTIGEAIVASTADDEVWVKEGTYYEHLAIEKPLSLVGGFRGDEGARDQRDWLNNVVTISGAYTGQAIDVRDSINVTIDGLTIIDGASTGDFAGAGGVTIREASCSILNCAVCFNDSSGFTDYCLAGGIFVINSTVCIKGCSIRSNKGCGGGGGIGGDRSQIWIINSDITENSASTGAGVYVSESTIELVSCNLAGNMAVQRGGGIESYRCQMLVRDTLFSGNQVRGIKTRTDEETQVGGRRKGSLPEQFPPKPTEGSALLSIDSDLLFQNCVFLNNWSQQDHFGSLFGLNDKTFENCTLFSESSNHGIVWEEADSSPSLKNCIVWSSETSLYVPSFNPRDPLAKVSYSSICGGYPGEGNVDADPKFVNAASGDFHLERGSPCIDSGTDTGLTTDFDGKPRPIGRYDMGAFEFPYLRSDINADDRVDAMDLLILEEDWGLVSGS